MTSAWRFQWTKKIFFFLLPTENYEKKWHFSIQVRYFRLEGQEYLKHYTKKTEEWKNKEEK